MANDEGWNVASGKRRNRKGNHGNGYGNGYNSCPGGKGAKGAGGGKGKGAGKNNAKGGGQGQGSGGQAGGTAGTKDYAQEWNIPRGTKVECIDPECTRIGEYANTAGWACPKCGTGYNWKEFWSDLQRGVIGGTTKGGGDNNDGGGGAATAGGEEDTKGTPGTKVEDPGGKGGKVEPPAGTLDAVNLAYKVWQKAKAKEVLEGTQFTDMGVNLTKILEKLDDQTARMLTKQQVVIDSISGQAAAKHIYAQRVAEQEQKTQHALEAVGEQLATITDRSALARRTAKAEVDSKAAELRKLQVEKDKADKAKMEREKKLKAGQEAAKKAVDEAAKLQQEFEESEATARTSMEALQHAQAGSSADDGKKEVAVESAPPCAAVAAETIDETAEESGADMSDAEEDEGAEGAPKEMDPETWTREIAAWAFFAKADDVPNPDLLGWFVSWEKNNTETIGKLEVLLLAARDKFLEARKGAASDGALVSSVAQTGDIQNAQQMQADSDVYNLAKYKEIHEQLVAHLKAGMQQLFDKRQADLEAGDQKAPKAWKYKANHQTRPVAGAKKGVKRFDKKRATGGMADEAKAAKDKSKAVLDEKGLKQVPGGTATAAANAC